MKKSLIAMALMFGAVVFVASCGGDKDEDKTCKTCTITITGYATGGSATSQVWTNKEYCDAELTSVEAANGANVTGADQAKGGSYVVECK